MNTFMTTITSGRLAIIGWLTLTLMLASPVLEAAHSLEDIAQTARQFIEETQPVTSQGQARREIDIRPLDPRLQLAECDRPLTAFTPGNMQRGGLFTIGIRCEGSSPWKIYVSGRVRLFQSVAVLARPLPKDAPIQPYDIEFREQDVSSLTKGYFTRAEELAGMTARRALTQGEVLTPTQLQAPTAVNKGQKVMIRAQGAAFDIVMTGEALRDGSIGERIQVRNLSSGRIVEALVQAPGEVLVSY